MPTKQELKNAYNGIFSGQEIPYKIINYAVEQMQIFLLGDGYDKKIKFLTADPAQQESLNQQLESVQFYRTLYQAYTDVLVYGETYIDYSGETLRHIPADKVTEVKVNPEDPLTVTYLKERREFFNPIKEDYEDVDVEHLLILNSPEFNPLDTLSYSYQAKFGNADPIIQGDKLPIVRLVAELDGRDSKSAIESIIHAQAEYNDLRRRIDETGRHHKPLPYTMGTSAPTTIGRTNKIQTEDLFDVSYTRTNTSIIHLPISVANIEAGITPKAGYLQPVDSNYLERQRNIILSDIYTLTGVLTIELYNSRSAASSTSLSILYEPLKRSTFRRATFLTTAITKIFQGLNISIPYRVELPNMMPKDVLETRLTIDSVKNKLMSRKRYLMDELQLTEVEAEAELRQLDAEKGLNIQYSGAIVDSLDAANLDSNTVLSSSAFEKANSPLPNTQPQNDTGSIFPN